MITGASRAWGRRPVAALTIAVAVAGPVVVALATRAHGANLSADSMDYLAGARSLAAGDGYRGVTGAPQALFPPGLSAVLALFGSGAVDAARWLHLAALGIVAAAVGLYLARRVRLALALAAVITLALGSPVVWVTTWVWSEPLYIVVTLVHLALLAALIGTPSPPLRANLLVVAAGVAAGGAVLVRYSGLTVLATGLVAVTLLGPAAGRVGRALCYLGPVVVLVGAWFLRDVLVTGTVVGERAGSGVSPVQVAVAGAKTIAGWLVAPGLPAALRVLGLVLVAGSALILVVKRPWQPISPADRRIAPARLLAVYLVLTAVLLGLAASTTNFDGLGDRLLAPLFPPLVVLLVLGADLVLDRPARVPRIAALVLAAAVVATPVGRTVGLLASNGVDGRGFNGPVWHSESARSLVAGVPPGARLVSDQPWAVYAITGRNTTESPRDTYYRSTVRPADDLATFTTAVSRSDSYLVWLPPDDYHTPPERLARSCRLVPMVTTSLGTTYHVVPLAAP